MNVQELIEYLQKLVVAEPEVATLLVTNPIEYDANNVIFEDSIHFSIGMDPTKYGFINTLCNFNTLKEAKDYLKKDCNNIIVLELGSYE
jgi:hypothetical protein